jgi:hypothetical protein
MSMDTTPFAPDHPPAEPFRATARSRPARVVA